MKTYKNDFGEEFYVQYSDYDINTTDNKKYEKIINPFELNTSLNYPYLDKEKNNSCFLEINEDILVIFKCKEKPSFDDMYEIYYNHITDSYDASYFHEILNKDNELVMAYGSSIIVLDLNNLEVLLRRNLDCIDKYIINIYYVDSKYLVEDIDRNCYLIDSELNELGKVNKEDYIR